MVGSKDHSRGHKFDQARVLKKMNARKLQARHNEVTETGAEAACYINGKQPASVCP